MTTNSLQMPTEGAREAYLDVASILAVALIGLVLLVVTNPRFGHDLDTFLRPAGTHSTEVTNQSAAR